MCEIAKTLKQELQNNNVDALGELLHENWIIRKSRWHQEFQIQWWIKFMKRRS